jgi:hypothetical protein
MTQPDAPRPSLARVYNLILGWPTIGAGATPAPSDGGDTVDRRAHSLPQTLIEKSAPVGGRPQDEARP